MSLFACLYWDYTCDFFQDVYTITVAEDHAVAAISFVPAIAATDTDTGVNNQITYVLTGKIYIQMFKSWQIHKFLMEV